MPAALAAGLRTGLRGDQASDDLGALLLFENAAADTVQLHEARGIAASRSFLDTQFWLVGLSVLCDADRQRAEFLSDALLTAAFGLLAVELLNPVCGLAGGESIAARLERLGHDLVASFDILKDTQINGLHRIVGTSRGFDRESDSWMGQLVCAKQTVEPRGYSLFVQSTGREFQSELQALLRRGVNIRILATGPGNTHFDALVNSHEIAAVNDVAAVKLRWFARLMLFNEVTERLPSGPGMRAFELRKVRTGLVVCQLCRINEWVAAILNLYSVVASESPLLEIRGSGSELFRQYPLDWLVRKPGAFERYRYKEDLFPTSCFRMAYDCVLRSSTPAQRTR